jgi:hypothetical protein
MTFADVTLRLPEELYQRLVNTARATQQPVDEIIVHALEIGSPPAWEDVPPEFQSDLAAMDRLDNGALVDIARSRMPAVDEERYDALLERNQDGSLTDAERLDLERLRSAADRLMLRKAHAAALLRWRGAPAPLP